MSYATPIAFYRTGANRVFNFDHVIRRVAADTPGIDGNVTMRGPGRIVHVDPSYEASENRAKYHLPNEAEDLLKRRFQIINVRLDRLRDHRSSSASDDIAD
jgi:hypothetical protein